MRLLDLFCGAGGAAMGYHRAGFDQILGVDNRAQPSYPFDFVQADALEYLDAMIDTTEDCGFDLIHASPPCQAYSDLQRRTGHTYPELIEPVREMLQKSGRPYVIENVEGAPLRNPTLLCGVSFNSLRVIRHRLFETTFPVVQPSHFKHPKVFTHDKRKAHYDKLNQDTSYVQVTGGGNSTVANARRAMGINWMTKPELNEAIPPAYTEWIGRQYLEQKVNT